MILTQAIIQTNSGYTTAGAENRAVLLQSLRGPPSHFLLRGERARIFTDFALAQQPEYSSVIHQSNLVHCIYGTLLQPSNPRLSHFLLRCERARICTDFALARSPEYSSVIH
jgi:hypothetical protein